MHKAREIAVIGEDEALHGHGCLCPHTWLCACARNSWTTGWAYFVFHLVDKRSNVSKLKQWACLGMNTWSKHGRRGRQIGLTALTRGKIIRVRGSSRAHRVLNAFEKTVPISNASYLFNKISLAHGAMLRRSLDIIRGYQRKRKHHLTISFNEYSSKLDHIKTSKYFT